jgi:hypothetical protein
MRRQHASLKSGRQKSARQWLTVGRDMTVPRAQSSGVYRLIGNDVSWTATGGSIATFRTAYLYNDTASNDEVIGYIDFGYGISVTIGQTFTID